MLIVDIHKLKQKIDLFESNMELMAKRAEWDDLE